MGLKKTDDDVKNSVISNKNKNWKGSGDLNNISYSFNPSMKPGGSSSINITGNVRRSQTLQSHKNLLI